MTTARRPPSRMRHVPERLCVACQRNGPKREFLRIRRGPDGHVRVDAGGRAPGRGAYVCRQASCWEAALTGNRLGGALHTNIEPPDRARLLQELKDSMADRRTD